MDEQVNSSDSDSSETWTVVDWKGIPTKCRIPKSETKNSDVSANRERSQHEDDTDTDGSIAVISDEEPDVTSTTPGYSINEEDLTDETLTSNTMQTSYAFSDSSNTICKDDDVETNSTSTLRESEHELSDEFFLSDFKIKSYVHRKNDRISSLLNAILLCTVMVTTVLAIGHMWGTTDDCSLNAINSVSRILFNMQKLQQENDMLKSKIMLLQSIQTQKPMTVDPSVFLDRENPFKSTEKRTDNYYQNSIKQTSKKSSNDQDTFKFDSNIVSTYPNSDSFYLSNRLHSNQTSEKPVEMRKKDSNIVLDDNVKNSKFSKRFKKYDKIECSQAPIDIKVSSFGPETYCESKFNKRYQKRQQKVFPQSNLPNDTYSKKKEKKNKASKTDKKSNKKISKVAGLKKSYSEISNNSEKVKRGYLKLNDKNSDWYYKMSNAREEFRKLNQYDKTNEKRKDKSNWYLRRMKDREAIRFHSEV